MNPPAGVPSRDYNQIDAIKWFAGEKQSVGQVLDPAKVEAVYELKSGANASVDDEQLGVLRNLVGGKKAKRVVPPRIYKNSTGWIANKRFEQGIKVLGVVGLATSAAAIVVNVDADEAFAELHECGNRRYVEVFPIS